MRKLNNQLVIRKSVSIVLMIVSALLLIFLPPLFSQYGSGHLTAIFSKNFTAADFSKNIEIPGKIFYTLGFFGMLIYSISAYIFWVIFEFFYEISKGDFLNQAEIVKLVQTIFHMKKEKIMDFLKGIVLPLLLFLFCVGVGCFGFYGFVQFINN